MTEMLHTRMSKEGRVLIPAQLRQALGLKTDEPMNIYAVEGELRLISRMESIRRVQAIAAKYKRPGVSVVDEFLRDKREEAARE